MPSPDAGCSLEGLDSARHGRSFQTLFGAWLLFTFIVSSAYSGNLNAFLVAVDYEDAVDTGTDILRSGRRSLVEKATYICMQLFTGWTGLCICQ